MMQRCIDATKEKDVITQQDPKYRQLVHHHFSQKNSSKNFEIRDFFCIFAEEFGSTKKAFSQDHLLGLTANR